MTPTYTNRGDTHAADTDPVEAGRGAAAAGRGDHRPVRAEGAAAGRPEAGQGRAGAGREALRGPQGQAVLREPAVVLDQRADGGDRLGGPRGGGRLPQPDGP